MTLREFMDDLNNEFIDGIRLFYKGVEYIYTNSQGCFCTYRIGDKIPFSKLKIAEIKYTYDKQFKYVIYKKAFLTLVEK